MWSFVRCVVVCSELLEWVGQLFGRGSGFWHFERPCVVRLALKLLITWFKVKLRTEERKKNDSLQTYRPSLGFSPNETFRLCCCWLPVLRWTDNYYHHNQKCVYPLPVIVQQSCSACWWSWAIDLDCFVCKCASKLVCSYEWIRTLSSLSIAFVTFIINVSWIHLPDRCWSGRSNWICYFCWSAALFPLLVSHSLLSFSIPSVPTFCVIIDGVNRAHSGWKNVPFNAWKESPEVKAIQI